MNLNSLVALADILIEKHDEPGDDKLCLEVLERLQDHYLEHPDHKNIEARIKALRKILYG